MMVEIIGMRFQAHQFQTHSVANMVTHDKLKLLMTMFGSQQIMEEFIIPLTGVIIGQYINLRFLTLEVQKLMVIYPLLTLKME